MLERLVTDAGGSYAFCDTDSMAIVSTAKGGRVKCETATGRTIRTLPWATVREILDRFDGLNPYEPGLLEPWKVEHESLERQLYCYAISAERHALYRTRADGTPVLVAAKDGEDEPTDDTDGGDDPLADRSEHRLGRYLDPTSKKHDKPQPQQKKRSKKQKKRRKKQKERGVWIDTKALPTAPYEAKPEHWDSLGWYDRSTGEPTTGGTHGLLLRRPVKSHPVRTLLTGKEGKKIIERLTGQASDVSDHRNDHGIRGDRWGLILQVLEGARCRRDHRARSATQHGARHPPRSATPCARR